jgi:hypothetical protein
VEEPPGHTCRPHGALGHLTASEYAQRGQTTASGAAEFQLRTVGKLG